MILIILRGGQTSSGRPAMPPTSLPRLMIFFWKERKFPSFLLHPHQLDKEMGKHESGRRRTRVLLVVGRRHVPSTRNLEREVFVCRNTVDATKPPSKLECRSENILQEPFKKYPLVSNLPLLSRICTYVSRFSFDVAKLDRDVINASLPH